MMDDTKNTAPVSQEELQSPQPPADRPILASGEKAFTVTLLVIGLIAFALALELWFRMSEPRIASAAALPLFVSGLWVVLALSAVIENRKLTSPLSGLKAWKEKLWKGLQFALPMEVVVMLGAIAAYCVTLVAGLSFYISTPIFLFATMCYLTRKAFVKNLLWTALIMAFIVLVFRMLFGVVFP